MPVVTSDSLKRLQLSLNRWLFRFRLGVRPGLGSHQYSSPSCSLIYRRWEIWQNLHGPIYKEVNMVQSGVEGRQANRWGRPALPIMLIMKAAAVGLRQAFSRKHHH
jgi:hypothetical protein